MAELVITSTTGMAIIGFVLMLLGFLGLLNVSGLLFWLAIQPLLFRLVSHENVFGTAFWKARLDTIKHAWTLPTLLIYVVFLFLLVPAILPATAWDSISYHLAYAVDWANAGRIYPDQFLRFPYYANNFVLIYALMFVLKFGQLCHFVTWLCGLLSGLGVYVFITEDGLREENRGRWLKWTMSIKEVVLPLTLALSPIFIKHLTVGYIDVPIGLFILVPVLCTYLILKGDSRNYEVDLLLTAAFCVGMKISMFLYLPLLGFSLILVVRRQQRRMSHLFALLAVLLVLSAPWYLRNFLAVGDPIPPTINLMLRGHDKIFSQRDYENLRSDLGTPSHPSALLTLPFNLFTNTDSPTFREPGTNLSVVLLYLPLATLLLMLFKSFRKEVGAAFVYLNLAVIYLLLNWLGISTLARYFLHLFPVYLGFLGICFNFAIHYVHVIAQTQRRIGLALQTSLLLLLLTLPVPSPTSKRFYGANLLRNYLQLPERLKNKEDFLRSYLPGYVSAQTSIDSLNATGNQDRRVLAVGFENLSFYFRERNVVNVGDWFGPGRYSDLMAAVDNSELASYLERFDIGAVVAHLALNPMSESQRQSFMKQLELSHFKLQPSVEPSAAVYLKTD